MSREKLKCHIASSQFLLSPSIHKFDDVFIYSIRPELMAEGGTKYFIGCDIAPHE